MKKKYNNVSQRGCLSKSFGSMRMRTQFLILGSILFISVIGLITATQMTNTYLSSSIFNQSSQTILINDLYYFLKTISTSLDRQVHFFFKRSSLSLTKINLLNQLLIYKTNYYANTFTQLCPNNSTQYPSYHPYPLTCVAYYEISNDYDIPISFQENQLRNFSQLTGSIALAIDFAQEFVPNDHFVISNSSIYGFAFFYPQWEKYSDYNPKNRSWYQEHFINLQSDPNNHIQLSKLYKYVHADTENVYSMTMTESLFNSSMQIDGVVACDIYLIKQYFTTQNVNMMIADKTGKLILSNYKNQQLASPYIYETFDDEKATGFNDTDWQSILNYVHNNITDSNCNLHHTKLNILCRYNSVYKQDVIIIAKQITQLPYYIILFNDMQEQIEMNQKIDQIISNLLYTFIFHIFITLIAYIILLVLLLIIIYIIFLPVTHLIAQSNSYIQQQFYIQNIRNKKDNLIVQKLTDYFNFQKTHSKNQQHNENNILKLLKYQCSTIFDRVLTSNFTKSKQCIELQAYKYPKNSIALNELEDIKNIQLNYLAKLEKILIPHMHHKFEIQKLIKAFHTQKQPIF